MKVPFESGSVPTFEAVSKAFDFLALPEGSVQQEVCNLKTVGLADRFFDSQVKKCEELNKVYIIASDILRY